MPEHACIAVCISCTTHVHLFLTRACETHQPLIRNRLHRALNSSIHRYMCHPQTSAGKGPPQENTAPTLSTNKATLHWDLTIPPKPEKHTTHPSRACGVQGASKLRTWARGSCTHPKASGPWQTKKRPATRTRTRLPDIEHRQLVPATRFQSPPETDVTRSGGKQPSKTHTRRGCSHAQG